MVQRHDQRQRKAATQSGAENRRQGKGHQARSEDQAHESRSLHGECKPEPGPTVRHFSGQYGQRQRGGRLAYGHDRQQAAAVGGTPAKLLVSGCQPGHGG